MKILFPLEVFYPSLAGGPANSVYWITKRLVRCGVNPVIIASDTGLPANIEINKWIKSDAGDVIYVRTPNRRIPLSQTLKALAQVRRADIVQISSVFYPANTATAIAASLLGKKIVFSPRGELDPKALEFSRWRKKLFLSLVKLFVGRRPVYHSTCDEETKYIRNMFGERASVVQIPNFIELPELKERSQQSYLLYLGRLDRKKAIDNLLRALKQSKVFAESNFVLKIAGRGLPEYEEYLTRLTADLGLGSKVEFLGQIGGDEKQQLLADAYFTLMPSHTENFGNVVLESLAQNTPVLASTGTPWSELEQVRVGMWVENSPASLAASIDKMLSIPEEEYEAMRSRSRTFVEERYDIERNYHHWIDLYNQL